VITGCGTTTNELSCFFPCFRINFNSAILNRTKLNWDMIAKTRLARVHLLARAHLLARVHVGTSSSVCTSSSVGTNSSVCTSSSVCMSPKTRTSSRVGTSSSVGTFIEAQLRQWWSDPPLPQPPVLQSYGLITEVFVRISTN